MTDLPSSNQIHELRVMASGMAGNVDEADDHSEVKLLRWAAAEIERLRKALIYSAHWQHSTPLHMLPEGIRLIDDNAVEVLVDGHWVYAGPGYNRSAVETSGFFTVEKCGHPLTCKCNAEEPTPRQLTTSERDAMGRALERSQTVVDDGSEKASEVPACNSFKSGYRQGWCVNCGKKGTEHELSSLATSGPQCNGRCTFDTGRPGQLVLANVDCPLHGVRSAENGKCDV